MWLSERVLREETRWPSFLRWAGFLLRALLVSSVLVSSFQQECDQTRLSREE